MIPHFEERKKQAARDVHRSQVAIGVCVVIILWLCVSGCDVTLGDATPAFKDSLEKRDAARANIRAKSHQLYRLPTSIQTQIRVDGYHRNRIPTYEWDSHLQAWRLSVDVRKDALERMKNPASPGTPEEGPTP